MWSVWLVFCDCGFHSVCLLMNKDKRLMELSTPANCILPILSPLICCCCSVTKSCLTPCNPLDCSIPGFPGLHYLPEFGQTHVHWVDDAIQPSHSLSPPSPPALNFFPLSESFPVSWLFASGGQSIGASSSASVLPMNNSGFISFRIDWFGLLWLQFPKVLLFPG